MKAIMYGLSIVFFIAPAASGQVTIEVSPSSAPNFFGSSSWGSYLSNALNSIENNLGNIGDRATDPTAYEVAGATVDAGDFMVSSFNSWRGTVNPPAPFANEFGNRMHFGLHAIGDGVTQYTLEDVSFEIHSSDAADGLVFVGDFVGFNYSATRFGIDWGADRMKGGGDDIVYNAGNGTSLVDEIVYVGVGNAFWPGGSDPDPANPIGGAQAAMDESIAFVDDNLPFSISGSYTILGTTESESVTVVPEPASLCLLLLGALAFRRTRRMERSRCS